MCQCKDRQDGRAMCNFASCGNVMIAITVNAAEQLSTLQCISAMGNVAIAVTFNVAEQCATF